ncbi:tRNA dihydrouridine(20/20a) synthase DusA, partial [archaeon]
SHGLAAPAASTAAAAAAAVDAAGAASPCDWPVTMPGADSSGPACMPVSTSAVSTHDARADIVSIAPMMEWTDRHYRYMMRLMTRHTKLYTEMMVDNMLIHSKNAPANLAFHPSEHPIAIQLGGSNPDTLAIAAKMAADEGYDEINLNCGCPSDRVAGRGCFGARLMFTPELVRDCVTAMQRVTSVPITIKCRLGADDMDSYEQFSNFIRVVAESGCTHFVVHARKCLLHGLNPKENRTIPPLRYHWVQRAAMEFPHLQISLNGGVNSIPDAATLLALRRGAAPAADVDAVAATLGAALHVTSDSAPASSEASSPASTPPVLGSDGFPVDPMHQLEPTCHRGDARQPTTFGTRTGVLASVMIGRAAYNNPWIFADADRQLFGMPNPGLSRREVVSKYLEYTDELLASVAPEFADMNIYRPFELAKPLLNLFHGAKGGGKFRTTLTRNLNEKRMRAREAVEDALLGMTDGKLPRSVQRRRQLARRWRWHLRLPRVRLVQASVHARTPLRPCVHAWAPSLYVLLALRSRVCVCVLTCARLHAHRVAHGPGLANVPAKIASYPHEPHP